MLGLKMAAGFSGLGDDMLQEFNLRAAMTDFQTEDGS